MIIDHSNIDPTDLQAHRLAAELSPDAEAYPWLESFPGKEQTVYSNGRLWTVGAVEKGPCANEQIAMVKLRRRDQDGTEVTTVTVRSELRPVTWNQADEDWLGRE